MVVIVVKIKIIWNRILILIIGWINQVYISYLRIIRIIFI
jgi:hypothetical protein